MSLGDVYPDRNNPVIETAFALCCACDTPLKSRDDAGFVSRRGEAMCEPCTQWLKHGGPAPWHKVEVTTSS